MLRGGGAVNMDDITAEIAMIDPTSQWQGCVGLGVGAPFLIGTAVITNITFCVS